MPNWTLQSPTTFRAGARSRAVSPLRFLGAALALGLILAPAVRAAEPLRWKFEKGETIRYSLVQKTETKLKSAAVESGSTVNQISDIRWVVEDVTPEGTGKLTQIIDRVRVKFEAGGSAFEFDSDDKDAAPADNPLAQQVVPVFRALAGFECSLTMDPRGRIEDVQIPEKTLESLRGTLAGSMSNLFSEDAMRKMISQSSLVLPENAVEPGGNWKDQSRLSVPQLGTIVTDKTYTVEGPARSDDSDVRIVLNANLAIEEKQNPDVGFEIKEQKHEGDFTFDSERGRISHSHVEVNMVQVITAGGNSVEQTVNNVMDMNISTPETKSETAAE